MKTWLSALAKLLVEFLILLALLSAAGAFAATLDAPDAKALGRAALEQALAEWPLALALSLTTGIVSFAGARPRSLMSLLSVALVGMLIATAGMAVRNLQWQAPARAQAFPLSGQAVETGDRLASISAIEAARVGGLVTVDWSKAMPRLSWHASAPYDAASSSALVGSTHWSLLPAWEKAESPISTGISFLDRMKPPLSSLEGEGLAARFARAIGFVLLCIGFGSISLRFRLPVSSLLVAIVAGLAASLFDSSAIAARLPSIAASLLNYPDFAIGAQWILPGAEALAGLAAVTAGFLLSRGVKE